MNEEERTKHVSLMNEKEKMFSIVRKTKEEMDKHKADLVMKKIEQHDYKVRNYILNISDKN